MSTMYQLAPSFNVDLNEVTAVVHNHMGAHVHTGDQVIKITYLPNDEACVKIPTSNAAGRFVYVSHENAHSFIEQAEQHVMPPLTPVQPINPEIQGAIFEKHRMSRLNLLKEREMEELRANSAAVMKQIMGDAEKHVEVLMKVQDSNTSGEYARTTIDFSEATSFSWVCGSFRFYEVQFKNGARLFATPKYFEYYPSGHIPDRPYTALGGKWLEKGDFSRVALLLEPSDP